MRKAAVIALTLLILPLAGTAAAYQSRIVTVLTACPAQEICVMMDITPGFEGLEVAIGDTDADGLTTLSFHGAIAHRGVEIVTSTRGGHGTVFYLKTHITEIDPEDPFRRIQVPSAGFQDGDPLIYTSAGLVRVTDGVVELGCADCGALITNGYYRGSPETRVRTPSHFADRMALSYDDDGVLYTATEAGCVRLANTSRFEMAASEKCALPPQINDYVMESSPGKNLPPCTSFYSHEQMRYALRLQACSTD